MQCIKNESLRWAIQTFIRQNVFRFSLNFYSKVMKYFVYLLRIHHFNLLLFVSKYKRLIVCKKKNKKKFISRKMFLFFEVKLHFQYHIDFDFVLFDRSS